MSSKLRAPLRSALVGFALAALAAGCVDRPQIWSTPQRLLGPYRVGNQVLWVEATRGEVIALDPTVNPPRVRRRTIGRNALFASPTPSRDGLAVLTAGKEALLKDQHPEAPALFLVKPSSDGLTLVRRFELDGAFDRLAISADDRFAVAYYGDAPQQGPAVFRNPNEVALLDLEQQPGADNPTLRTLRSFGSAPLGVIFSPRMKVPRGGKQRTLALVLARNYLTFIDMDHRARSEITVPLAPAESEAEVIPQQVLFAPEQPAVYVRAAGAADLFALSLEPKPATNERENDYRPTINQPSSGRVVADMALVATGEDGAPSRILTANASGDLSLIDAATSEFVTIDVGEPVDKLLLVPPDKPTLALVYSSSQPRPRVHFLELDQLAERREANLTHRSLAKPVHQLVRVPGDQLALVVHNDARDVISLLDLVGEHHTDTPIQGRQQLHSFDFVGEDYLVGVSPGIARLGLIDLKNLHALDLRLDHNPKRVLAVGQTLVVDHGAATGLVTILPRPDANRDEARVLWGFVLGDLLDLGLED